MTRAPSEARCEISMTYYSSRLSGLRLQAVYDLATPRIRRYLDEEIAHVRSRLRRGDLVLELGCGYGRVMWGLAIDARCVVGIDTAPDNLALARTLAPRSGGCAFTLMDAVRLGFRNGAFDLVACVQNGICAFRVDPFRLMSEALRVTRPGGRVLFSTYAEAFWPHRLEWFERQADVGLVGTIDRQATGDGLIACLDGFRSGTMRAADFEALCRRLGVAGKLEEVDGSSLFCEVTSV